MLRSDLKDHSCVVLYCGHYCLNSTFLNHPQSHNLPDMERTCAVWLNRWQGPSYMLHGSHGHSLSSLFYPMYFWGVATRAAGKERPLGPPHETIPKIWAFQLQNPPLHISFRLPKTALRRLRLCGSLGCAFSHGVVGFGEKCFFWMNIHNQLLVSLV